MIPSRASMLLLGLAVLGVLAGCRDREIASYRAPKDPPQAEPPTTAMTSTNNLPAGHPPVGPITGDGSGGAMTAPVPTAEGADLTWTAPDSWHPKAASAMRKGSFSVPGAGGEADLSITAFPGATGGLDANLNRWRGQVGLPPQSATEIVAATEKFSSNGLDFVLVDYAGNGKRLLGAVVAFGGNSWFFKLMGPDALVEDQKSNFVAFLHSVKVPTP